MSPVIRRATPADGPAFLRLVRELAEFEKLDPPTPDAQARLLADAFGARARFELHVAEAEGEVVAYAITFETYSSFLAKPTLYLEDLYVTPAHRGKGVSHAMMRRLAALAAERGCGRLEGVVLAWNARARRFYAKTGARELGDWIFFRYDLADLAAREAGLLAP
jgi:GNAT superfamily N-acetyltransferase